MATAAVPASNDTAPEKMPSAPERDIAHAVVLAAAIDNAEHNHTRLHTTSHTGPAEARQLHAPPIHRRVRVPSCKALPCNRNSLVPQETVELKPQLKAKPRRVAARNAMPDDKEIRRLASLDQKKIASNTAPKLLKKFAVKTKTQKIATTAKIGTKGRAKSEIKIALRRFRETPAEISYRSFVGKFVPAT